MADPTTDKPATADKPASRKPTPVPDGHRRVMWVYCAADTDKNGTVEDIDAEDAKELVRSNRVAYVDADTPLGATDQPTRR